MYEEDAEKPWVDEDEVGKRFVFSWVCPKRKSKCGAGWEELDGGLLCVMGGVLRRRW